MVPQGFKRKQRMRVLAFAGTILFLLAYTIPGAAAEKSAPPAPLILFGAQSTNVYPLDRVKSKGMIEYWRTVLHKHGENNAFASGNNSMSQPVRKQWEALTAKFPKLSQTQQLQTISAFINQLPGESDHIGYGEEHWAYPAEFLSRYRGDCKAYAAAKYLALRHLGWPEEALWLVLVFHLSHNEGHAVGAAQKDGQIFILDNLSRPKDLIMPHEKQASIYRPVLAFNETTVWFFPGTQ